jgi:hypothetical protein
MVKVAGKRLIDGVKIVKALVNLVTLTSATTAATSSITGVAKEFARTVPGYSIQVLEIAAQ